jgi:hypothetical protein
LRRRQASAWRPARYNYEKVQYNDVQSKESLLTLHCNICKRDWLCTIANHIYNRTGCPYCNMSIGESSILNILVKCGVIQPKSQFILNPYNDRRYDFLFEYNNKSYIVEYEPCAEDKLLLGALLEVNILILFLISRRQ